MPLIPNTDNILPWDVLLLRAGERPPLFMTPLKLPPNFLQNNFKEAGVSSSKSGSHNLSVLRNSFSSEGYHFLALLFPKHRVRICKHEFPKLKRKMKSFFLFETINLLNIFRYSWSRFLTFINNFRPSWKIQLFENINKTKS